MSKQKRIYPEQLLRAWADAFTAVADLQAAIVREAEKLTMLDDMLWLNLYRSLVTGTLKTAPDKLQEPPNESYQAAIELKETAVAMLIALKDEARRRAKGE